MASETMASSACTSQTAAPKAVRPLKDQFLSRDDHLDFRSCAKLNTALDNVLPRAPGQSAAIAPIKDRSAFKGLLTTHCQILVCKNEVVALVVSGAGLTATQSSAAVASIKDPRIVIAANPDPDDYKIRQKEHEGAVELPTADTGETTKMNKKKQEADQKMKEQDGPPHKVTLTKIDVTGTNLPPQDVVLGVLEQMAHARSSRESFTQHVRTYFQYLRAVHCATTHDEHKICTRRLRDYVFLKSHPKMLSRFNSGAIRGRDKHQVNFWLILTDLESKLPEHARHIEPPMHLKGKKPNLDQADRIARHLAGKSGYIESIVSMDVYTTHADRLRFHGMLVVLLRRARRGLLKLQRVMDAARFTPIGEVDLEEVNAALSRARVDVTILLNTLDEFDMFLLPHFEWLAEAAGVVGLNETPTWSPYAVQTPMHQTEETLASGRLQDYPDAEANEEEGDEDVAVLEHAQSQEGSNANSRTHESWALACKVFVRLPCLHEVSLRRATRADPVSKTGGQLYESALVQQAEVMVVNFEINSWDKQTAVIDEAFIEKLRRYAPGLEPTKLIEYLQNPEIIKVGNLIQKAQNTQPTTTGAPHCETILMCLIAIAKNKEIMSHVCDEQLKVNGIFATTEDLLRFPDNMTMVAGSKSACPPCEKTRQQMPLAIDTKNHFAAPGFHNKWSGVLLPSFMPLTLGTYVVESTKIETAQKLLQFQILVDANNAKLERIKQKESPQSEKHKAQSSSEDGESPQEKARKYAKNTENREKYDLSASDDDDDDGDEGDEPAAAIAAHAAVGAGGKRNAPRDFTADRDRVQRQGPA